ncbi:MAG: 50S ribosomal protein L22 [Nanoarchaeota archaeon]|nr:50S ribosomal protein L22 [Nanoarchaeota archaeon]
MTGYAFKGNEHTAKARGESLPVSSKHSIEICSYIRGKRLEKAKRMLQEVISMKEAVPFKRFHGNMGHKSGMAAGRYPVKAVTQILKVLDNAEANAQFKGLNTSSLKIVHICANRAARPMRHGRHGGVQSKRTHVEIVVQESEPKKKGDKPAGKQAMPVGKPAETRPAEKMTGGPKAAPKLAQAERPVAAKPKTPPKKETLMKKEAQEKPAKPAKVPAPKKGIPKHAKPAPAKHNKSPAQPQADKK